MAARWKATYPSILRAVVLTGTDITKLPPAPGVDRILPKVVDPDELIEVLELNLPKNS